jgi:competence protein ComEA
VALFSNVRPTESDGRQRARARLVAMRGDPAPAPDRIEAGPVDQDPAVQDPAVQDLAASDPAAGLFKDTAPAPAREGRLVRRWVPGPLREARWEPGRPGALMLSLVAALAAVIAAVGVWRDRPVPVPAPALPLVAPSAVAAPTGVSPPAAAKVVVSVVGRVARPGLVQLAGGARVADALEAAGGALPGTDLVALNLARRLSDGEQLLVGVPPPPGQPVDGGVVGAPAGPSAMVDLNTATLEQLDALPGVGPVTAQRILDWRTEHGRFTSVDQLREVSGIGEARFAQLRDLVRV